MEKSLIKRVKSMLKTDFRRLVHSPVAYIMAGVALAIPVLVIVMTTMMEGTTTDPVTGAVTTIEGFVNVWQMLGSVSGASAGMSMDITSMCNINLLYFLSAVLTCIFVADDFRSGYVKNLFAVRAKKSDYVISKTLVGFVGGAVMIVCFFIGSLLGGAIAGLSFSAEVGAGGIVCCLISKVLLMLVFTSIFVLVGAVAKQKLWLSLIISLGASMLLFNIAPVASPLNASILNVVLCLVGGALFAVGLGCASNAVLDKTDLL